MRRANYGRFRGMSQGAVLAREAGRLPLYQALPEFLRQLKVKGIKIKKSVAKNILLASHGGEWHHTSKYANRTSFYSLECAFTLLEKQSGEFDRELERPKVEIVEKSPPNP